MAQKAQVDWSPVDKRSIGGPYLANITKGRNNEFITLQMKAGSLFNPSSTPIFTRYDRQFHQLLSKEPLKSNSHIEISSLENFNGNLFLFTKLLQSKWSAASYTLQAIPVDPVTLEAGVPKDLVTFDGHNKQLAARPATAMSTDGSKVLLFASEPFNNDEDKKYYLGICDSKLNKLWERVLSLPSAKFMDLRDHLVSNDGQVYLLCRQYDKQLTKLPFGKVLDNASPYSYKVFVYSPADSAPREYSLDLKGKFVHEATLHFDNSGRVRMVGLYKSGFAGRISGSFSATLDQDARHFVTNKMEPFPQGNLLSPIAADGCGSADANDPGLDPAFKLAGVNRRTDGSIDLLTEYNAESHHSSVSLATHTMVEETTYKRYDVVVVSFKNDGRIIYSLLPKKQEESPFWTHISIRYMNHGSDLLIFYNANAPGNSTLPDNPAAPQAASGFVMATINEAGELQRQIVFSNNDPDMMADMMLCLPVDADAMTLYVSKMRRVAGDKYQFGLLTFQ